MAAASHRTYALEQLYVDQDRDWVIDTVPAVLAWLPVVHDPKPPFAFSLAHAPTPAQAPMRSTLALTWDVDALAAHDPAVRDRARRMRSGRTAQREHVAELAAYGLALAAISVLLPGRRVVDMEHLRAPDLLLDATPGACRGVEVAARSSGGWPALRRVRQEKRALLRAKTDVVEAHLSLWCAWPRAAEFCMVVP